MSKHLESTEDPSFSTYHNGKWNYKDFYKAVEAAGVNRDTDTFICLNDGYEYVPGENEMFRYIP